MRTARLLVPCRVGPRASVVPVIAALVLSACTGGTGHTPTAPAPPPAVVTVPELQNMLLAGEAPSVVLGEIERSGTVYRLTTEQRANLRAAGMPAAILSSMETTYANAIAKQPALATSNERW